MPLILGANSVTGGYEVDNSLRFNSGSTEYLQRTPGSAGSLTTWTYSFWTKRSVLATAEQYLSAGPRGGGGNVEDQLYSISTDQINWYDGTAASNVLRTTQLFRDVSAWYHLMFVWDTTNATASDRAKIYVNGAEVTAFSVDNNPSLNAVSKINGTGQHRIGQVGTLPGENLDGYLAEVNFIDGQALDPDNFGEFDSDTGIWKPIVYTGSYGTNGFLLEFKDSSALGDDTSGNTNDFTVNNLTSIDQTTDTPTNNFCTMSPLTSTQNFNLSNGNLKLGAAADNQALAGTIAGTVDNATSGYYFEYKVNASNLGSSGEGFRVGILNANDIMKTSASARVLQMTSADLIYETATNGGAGVVDTDIGSAANGDIVMVAWKNGKVWFGVNGTWVNSGDPSAGTGEQFSGLSGDYIPWIMCSLTNGVNGSEFNFGNAPYTITTGNADANGYGNFEYTVPTGYYALNTKNLAEFG
jgi:hypothetical protein